MADAFANQRQRQLSAQLLPLRECLPPQPNRGWLHTVREAYGLSLEIFGARLGMTRQGARRIELAEASGAISVRKLREAADALECDLAVVLVPRGRLEEIVRGRAEAAATDEIARIDHSMALEDQKVGDDARLALIRTRAQEMIDDDDPRIWRP